MSPIINTGVRRVILPAVAWTALMIVFGWLLGHAVGRLIGGEDAVNRALAAGRTPTLNTVTHVVSTMADTWTVAASLCVFAVCLRLVDGRWDGALVLLIAVPLQVAAFVLTSIVIDRARPDVPHLDPAPPTSSFPSGHTGAATALYGGLALLVAWRVHRTGVRVPLVAVLSAVPVLVAVARLYRGMHHPSDVVFGVINGLVCIGIAVYAAGPRPIGRHGSLRASGTAGVSRPP